MMRENRARKGVRVRASANQGRGWSSGDISAMALACERSDRFRRYGLGDIKKKIPRCLAVIPARGGSERVRNKNILPFLGRPLLRYSLDVARGAGIFSRVHVSTESEEIASVARAGGYAPEFMRDVSLADDVTGVWSVVRWVVERFRDMGEEYDCVCLLSACMPLLDAEDLRGGMGYYVSLGGRYHIVSCCEYLSSPLRALSLSGDGEIVAMDGDSFRNPRSQDLGDYVMDCGAFAIRGVGGLLGENEEVGMRGYLLEREKGVDINTERDLAFAEVLYRGRADKTGAR